MCICKSERVIHQIHNVFRKKYTKKETIFVYNKALMYYHPPTEKVKKFNAHAESYEFKPPHTGNRSVQ